MRTTVVGVDNNDVGGGYKQPPIDKPGRKFDVDTIMYLRDDDDEEHYVSRSLPLPNSWGSSTNYT
jgi:hypothetical protein